MTRRERAGNGAGGKIEKRDWRRRKQRRIGDAARDDEIGAVRERFRDRLEAEIGVRAEPCAVFDRRRPGDFVAPGHEIVAENGGDLKGGEAELHGKTPRLLRRRQGVGGAEIGHDPATGAGRGRQKRRQAPAQPGIVAGLGVRVAGAQCADQSALGEAFQSDSIDLARGSELHRGLDAVAGKTGAGADAAGPLAHHKPM